MSKRVHENRGDRESESRKSVKFAQNMHRKQHTLDSDEEEDEERDNILDDDEIEGEESSETLQLEAQQDKGERGVRMTAFNMQEEMEMGHFDRDGHFIWNNEKEVRDNWLDNVDWQNVKTAAASEDHEKGLGEESSDEEEDDAGFDAIAAYRNLAELLQPGESVNKALKRLAGSVKMTSMERLRRRRAGTLESHPELSRLTELANAILTRTGNMDIYEETHETLTAKGRKRTNALDMYADDFGDKEKLKLAGKEETTTPETVSSELQWEFKWDRETDVLQGPFSTQQMSKWATEGYFKAGAWVRKCGATDTTFYASNRLDFELYL